MPKSEVNQKSIGDLQGTRLALGPFGSNNNIGCDSGSTSLPTFGCNNKNSNIFNFEVGSSFSDTKGSGSISMLTFGMEPKKYNWSSNSDNSLMEISSGGSSRTSSGHGSNSQLDWGGTVEGVFREEIGKMAMDYQRRSSFKAF